MTETKLPIFISWSGELSRQLGEALTKWLPWTVQYVEPFFSPNDLENGSKWFSEISQRLLQSSFCIIALTN